MRYFLVLVVLICCFKANAQEVDKGSWYVHLVSGSAAGDYKTYLKNYNRKTSKIGFDGGFLFNLQRKSGVNSPVQVGAELGFMPWGTDNVDSQVGGSFSNSHRSIWINGVVRYRPILSASTINPFFDLFVGPEFIKSNITEVLSSGETTNIIKVGNTTKNYGLGAGLGIKRENRNGELRYIDIGLYYQYAEKVRSIRRNSAFILSDGSTDYEETIIKPTTIQVKIGFTGFL
ncbi:hypothetical protein [Arcticibacterium luteifluviistationis]|uniref:Outer membrane protein beta-barrel domain-containing protein n=1 Tax=Arcticibacterium luteifluviistationis TaxID=1784714 RepID=A0A2Z4G826_9BACT|nr:hypothetical protein [Arcticibacterium luteifluviistationis]AWV97324.1 hypothetical protein DJ013_03715 [Arcticibacterium luteifluviistationis]